jgi:hypothetical protein
MMSSALDGTLKGQIELENSKTIIQVLDVIHFVCSKHISFRSETLYSLDVMS